MLVEKEAQVQGEEHQCREEMVVKAMMISGPSSRVPTLLTVVILPLC